MLGIFMGGYQDFKFENSLVSSIYPTSPLDYELNKIPSTEPKAKKVLMRTVQERGKYFYSYAEYLFAKWCSWWCCCMKGHWLNRRIKKLQRHDHATETLAKEVDICKLVYA